MAETNATRWSLVAMAALLDQARLVHAASLALTLVPALIAASLHDAIFVSFAAAAVLVLVIEVYLAVRCGIDAKLFAQMADASTSSPASLGELDRGLLLSGLAQMPSRERTLEQRISGARRLFRQQCIAAAALTGLVLATLVAAGLASGVEAG